MAIGLTPVAAPIEREASARKQVVAKALEKDRDLRYQHAADICADVKPLRDTDTNRLVAQPQTATASRTAYYWPRSASADCSGALEI